MPTYVYQCAACGHEFERFESITAKPNKTCPKCHKKKGERQISGGAGLIFKGSGFYTTDYRKSSYKESAKKDSSASTSPSSGSSDSKASGGEAKSGGETKSGGESKGKSSDKGKGKSK